jgi:hypothetical protein
MQATCTADSPRLGMLLILSKQHTIYIDSFLDATSHLLIVPNMETLCPPTRADLQVQARWH